MVDISVPGLGDQDTRRINNSVRQIAEQLPNLATLASPDFTGSPTIGGDDIATQPWVEGKNYVVSVSGSGDVTAPIQTGGAVALTLTIAANAVTFSKFQQVGSKRFLGNVTGSTANVAELTAAQVTAELPTFVGDTGAGGAKGLVPATVAGDSAKVLYGNGAWGAAPTQVFAKRYYTEYSSVFSTTAVIPVDDTIPLNTEGVQIMSKSITVDSTSQYVRICAILQVSCNTLNYYTAGCIFDGSTCLRTNFIASPGANYPETMTLLWEGTGLIAGSHTITVRVGVSAGGMTINGVSGSRLYGGSSACSMAIDVFN